MTTTEITIPAIDTGGALAILVDLFHPARIVVGDLGPRLGDVLLEPARNPAERAAPLPLQ